ncbi:MAG: class I SAM-dependent methyltransferase [Verrucomicrobia bacterium]|nr:class I SAM-dependent methyltransferase [Verrucomicrobiota bacterium]
MQDRSKEQVAAFYEEHQKRGKYDYLYGDAARKDLLVRLIGLGKTILEIGCRAGNLTQHYMTGNQVTGLDVDRQALGLFEQRLGLKGHWVDVDAEPLPFAPDVFDVVVFSEVMEHVRFPQRVLAEIARVLKPDGRLVGSVPNSFRLRNRLRFLFGRPFETDPSHLRSYSHELLRKELSTHFDRVEIHPVSGHLLGGGRTGIPVYPWLPYRVRTLFALDLVFFGMPSSP